MLRRARRGLRPKRLPVTTAVVLLAAALTGIGLTVLANGSSPVLTTPTRPPIPILAAAGDIACDPKDPRFNHGNGQARACHMRQTSDLLASGGASAVLALGDVQYGHGGTADYRASYAPAWGRSKAVTHPILGDGDYDNQGAAGYFRYFGAAAGPPNQGWYSFDLGAWHVIVLNSNCSHVGGCQPGSPQERWLKADLATHPARCTLAAWHLPLFGSNAVRVDDTSLAFWHDLSSAGAELVLNGNNHFYERFAPQDPSGKADPTLGIREFIVGTGGRDHQPLDVPLANSQVRNDTTFGVLELTLRPSGYDWVFTPEAGADFTDSGSGTCH